MLKNIKNRMIIKEILAIIKIKNTIKVTIMVTSKILLLCLMVIMYLALV